MSRKSRFSLLTACFFLAGILLACVSSSSLIKNSSVAVYADAYSAHNYSENITVGKANASIGGGGYVTGVYLHPKTFGLAYIRTDVGGIYRWNDQNLSWIPLFEGFSRDESELFGGEALALDPNESDIVYVAAGKYSWAENQGTILKSIDRGISWKRLDVSLRMGGNESKRWLGERLVVDPFDSNHVVFGSRYDGLWQSFDAGNHWSRASEFIPELDEGVGITSISFHPIQRGTIFVNAYGDGIYYSEDSGMSWQRFPDSPRLINRITVSSGGKVFATLEDEKAIILLSSEDKSITKYSVSGANAPLDAIDVSPTNEEWIIVASSQSQGSDIFETKDGGNSWAKVQRETSRTVPWWPEYFFANHVSSIKFDPFGDGKVWFSDWYGVWINEDIRDRSSAWKNFSKGHEEVVAFDLVSPPVGAALISGLADVDGFYHNNGLDNFPSRKLGIDAFESPAFQDTYSIDYCQTQPLEMVRAGGNRWSGNFAVAGSKDGGVTWSRFKQFPEDRKPLRVAMSASNPDFLIVLNQNEAALFSRDGGKIWETVSGLPDGPGDHWYWSQPLASASSSGNLFYYYSDGNFYRSDNGEQFEIVSSDLPRAGFFKVEAVLGRGEIVFVSLGHDGLFRSQDFGETFEKIGSVNEAHLFSIGVGISGAEGAAAVYVYGILEGQGDGIYRSLDLGETWTRVGDPNYPIGNEPNTMEASKQFPGLLFVGTNGRGIYYGTSKD